MESYKQEVQRLCTEKFGECLRSLDMHGIMGDLEQGERVRMLGTPGWEQHACVEALLAPEPEKMVSRQ